MNTLQYSPTISPTPDMGKSQLSVHTGPVSSSFRESSSCKMLLDSSGRRIGRPVFRYIGHLSLSGLCDVVPDRRSNPGFPSASLIAFLSASSASYRILCSLNHAMASTYDIRLSGRWGAVNLDLPKLTIAAVAGSCRPTHRSAAI